MRFNSGDYPIVATSRVLNEGVNVPEANVAVILSGSGSVREHVQRLGRILRKSGDKEAQPLRGHHPGDVEEFTSNEGASTAPTAAIEIDRARCPMPMNKLVFLGCLASTLFMTGLIWFVQVVHYPLFDRVESGAFRRYHADHTRPDRPGRGPADARRVARGRLSRGTPSRRRPALVGLGRVRLHPRGLGGDGRGLGPGARPALGGFAADTHRLLVRTNLIRTASWTAHSA